MEMKGFVAVKICGFNMSEASLATRSQAVLALRLTPPIPPTELVIRAQIDAQLQAAQRAALVLFCGPAGFGKTTVMARYFEQLQAEGVATVWILLDDADNDVERFLFKVHTALDGNAVFGDAASGADTAGARLDLPSRLAAAQAPFAVFFDDFEQLRNPVVLDLFREALDSLPARGRVVVGTREHARLNLGRWRVSGRMTEVGLTSLRFSATEAQELLHRRTGVALSAQVLGQLYERTEGWPVALQLAALSLARHPDPAAFAAAFSGSNAAVADYLLETVISGQSDATREFLLTTSVLDELNAELCDAVTGRTDSQAVLDELERSNVFLTPVDDDRRRYRYHALFADFLRGQLARLYPGRAHQLHLAASTWFVAQGRGVPAINHALASGDFQRTLGLLEGHAEQMLREGRFRLLNRWFDALPFERVRAHPMLALVYAGALALTRRQRQALSLLDQIESSAEPGGDAQQASLRVRVGTLRGLALAMLDRADECLNVCQRYCSPGAWPTDHSVGMLNNALASSLINATRFDDAMVVLAEAKRRHAAAGSTFNMAIAECVHGSLELIQGRLPDALVRLRGAMNSLAATRTRHHAVGGSSALGVGLATVLYHNGQLAEAHRLLTECLPLVKEAGPPDTVIPNHLFLARCARAFHETDLSLQRLADLELFGHSNGLPRLVATAWLERSKWAVIDGATEAAHEYLRQAASFREVWEQAERFPATANDLDDLALATFRLQVRTGQGMDVLPALRLEIAKAEATRRAMRSTLLRLLLVEVMMNEGQSRPALRQMVDLIDWAAAGGYVRLFADEGPVIARLLLAARPALAADPRAARQMAFVDQVLQCVQGPLTSAAAQEAPPPSGATAASIEPLSEREQQVLRLLDMGCSNRVIGERLFISENTVKVHLRNLNAKLGTNSRAQAVSAARRLGLLN